MYCVREVGNDCANHGVRLQRRGEFLLFRDPRERTLANLRNIQNEAKCESRLDDGYRSVMREIAHMISEKEFGHLCQGFMDEDINRSRHNSLAGKSSF